MASRTKRKRHRRRQAKATAAAPDAGWGGGALKRRDLIDLRRAIREGWPTPRQRRRQIFDALRGSLDRDAPQQLQIAVVRLLIAAENVNQRAEHAGREPPWPINAPASL